MASISSTPSYEHPANRTTSAETDRFKWLLRQYIDDEERSRKNWRWPLPCYTSTKDEKRLADQLAAERHPQADVMRLIVDSAGFGDSEEEGEGAAGAEEEEEEDEALAGFQFDLYWHLYVLLF
ncbi:hypothetical protein DL766_002932 [Monosporascus sp. MC13-8B]|uniref:Uncharacterized protein n=1 Tax=Monosporascus cannonballus TaxID=155416 RepID=A0ABY0GZF3_9PEZI|nr:hypothetical protein DL762_007512 [Monosporascus cannonballus]RYO83525.1 hypothetical protein DL763_007850 [Monosporascus cannonballus]RYP34565.1 hypothetical protein DL766_002932 [Monosporascus sp. MC13-8B]